MNRYYRYKLELLRLSEYGVAFLELAWLSIFVMLVGTWLMATYDFLRSGVFLDETVQQYITESSVKPMQIEIDSGGLFTINIATSAIETYLDEVRNNVEAQIGAALVHGDSTKYYIETAYADLNIDEVSGRVNSWNINAIESNGVLTPGNTPELPTELYNLLSNGVTPSPYAIPHGLFEAGGAADNYINKAILVGIRVFVSFDGSFSGKVIESIGREPILSAFKIIALRGEFS